MPLQLSSYLLWVGFDKHRNDHHYHNVSPQLTEYREQSYLLDPFLERIVVPSMNIFKNHILNFVTQQASGGEPTYSRSRLSQLVNFIYSLTKFRGRKTIGVSSF